MQVQKSNFVRSNPRLTRNEMKNIKGGIVAEGGGSCITCHTDSGMVSCWYTKSSGEDLCSRVYPGQSGFYWTSSCSGCTMN
jgi:hypothetical protein